MSDMHDDIREALAGAIEAGVTQILATTADDLAVWLAGFMAMRGWTKLTPAPKIQLPKSPGPRP